MNLRTLPAASLLNWRPIPSPFLPRLHRQRPRDFHAFLLVTCLGSVSFAMSGPLNSWQSRTYDAWGGQTQVGGANNHPPSPFGFTGESQEDPASAAFGLVYLRSRWYDPSTGRFISRDSFGGVAGDPQSL